MFHGTLRFVRVTGAIPLIAISLLGCSQQGGGGMFQTGQIIGGATKQMADTQPTSGFLPNSSLLHGGATGQADLVYLNPSTNLSSYNAIIIDPVAVWAAPGSSLENTSQQQRTALANTFTDKLYKSISARCRV